MSLIPKILRPRRFSRSPTQIQHTTQSSTQDRLDDPVAADAHDIQIFTTETPQTGLQVLGHTSWPKRLSSLGESIHKQLADVHPAYRDSYRNTAFSTLNSIPEAQPVIPAVPRPLRVRKRPLSKEPVSSIERIEELTREVGRLEDAIRAKNEVIRKLEERIRRQIEMKNFVLWNLKEKEIAQQHAPEKRPRRTNSMPDGIRQAKPQRVSSAQ